MKRRSSLSVVAFLLLFPIASMFAQSPPVAPAKEFVHGLWFDGKGFQARTIYAVEGKLVKKRPKGGIETIDLQNGYVVPPLGDAHNHFPDSANTLQWAGPLFLASGVLYILNPNDIAELSNPLRPKLATAPTVDVIFAHAGFTCTGGHPAELYEALVDRKVYSYSKPQLESRAFYTIDTPADIDNKWPKFLSTKPDFVKLYLLHAEKYSHPASDPVPPGLRPEFIPELTKRAHAAGLRAGAHIESAQDFHFAVIGGVDFVMHLPGYHWRAGDTEKDYLIDDADIRLAAKKRIIVETTINRADQGPKEQLERIRRVQIENLRRLKDAGVPIVIGTDGIPGKIMSEVDDLHATGVFSNLELLRMLATTTPLAIFPNRRIGHLEDGYEASFLVLKDNPLNDPSALKEITLRVKKGEVLKP